MTRKEILTKAMEIVTGDRDLQYGSPENNFRQIALFWSTYLELSISEIDVANMMILLKVARLKNMPQDDSWVDIAGYAACGSEVSDTSKFLYSGKCKNRNCREMSNNKEAET